MTLELHNTENPISNTERLKINENWQRIISGYSYLQQQIKVLAGGSEVDELIQRLNEAVDGANIAVQQAIDANNTATQEAIEANNTALQTALTTVSQTLVDVNKAIANANTATSEANTAKQGALDVTAQAQTALTSMQSLITNLGSKGVWNDTTQYYKNNLAVFNGSTFIASQDNLGKSPPTLPIQSNAYWSLFAEKGATGATGGQGPPGKDGKDGTGVNIIGELMSEDDLPLPGSPGDAYMIKGDLHVWQVNLEYWKNVGPIQGPEGKSAYDLAVENGFIGTMEEWIESLKGPPGPMGPPGPPADLTEINQQVSKLQTEVTEHLAESVASENGAQGLRYFNDKLEYSDDSGWNKIETGGSNQNEFYESTYADGTYSIAIPQVTEYKTGMSILFKPSTTNTGVAYIDINNFGKKQIFYITGQALNETGILATTMVYNIVYNGYFFVIMNIVKLNDTLTSTSTKEAATAYAVKQVNDKLLDTYWVPLAINSGFTKPYDSATAYRKIGKRGYLRIECTAPALSGGTDTIKHAVCTLPVGYRPPIYSTGQVMVASNGHFPTDVTISNWDGVVSIHPHKSYPAGATIVGIVAFLID